MAFWPPPGYNPTSMGSAAASIVETVIGATLGTLPAEEALGLSVFDEVPIEQNTKRSLTKCYCCNQDPTLNPPCYCCIYDLAVPPPSYTGFGRKRSSQSESSVFEALDIQQQQQQLDIKPIRRRRRIKTVDNRLKRSDHLKLEEKLSSSSKDCFMKVLIQQDTDLDDLKHTCFRETLQPIILSSPEEDIKPAFFVKPKNILN